MVQRVAARLVTGPLAFLLGGVIELAGYAARAARARAAAARRRGGRRAR